MLDAAPRRRRRGRVERIGRAFFLVLLAGLPYNSAQRRIGREAMIAVREQAEQRIVLHNISWQGYENLLREIGDRHVRLTYDNGDLEIMTLSFAHENAGEWLGRLVFFLAVELNIAICSGGSTTLRKALRRKGLEPDKSFWIKHERHMRGKKEWDVLTDPPPDL